MKLPMLALVLVLTAAEPPVGRYRITPGDLNFTSPHGIASSRTMFLLDTTTGKAWYLLNTTNTHAIWIPIRHTEEPLDLPVSISPPSPPPASVRPAFEKLDAIRTNPPAK